MENQRAKRLAQEEDPDYSRTIGSHFHVLTLAYSDVRTTMHAGVLTKQDTLGLGATNARQKWVDVLKGRAYKTKYGYFCVRLADDTEREAALSRSEMQDIGNEFFSSEEPWNQFSDQGRFGIPALVTNLSHHLITIIDKTYVLRPFIPYGHVDYVKIFMLTCLSR